MVSGEDSKSYQIDSQDYTRARSRKNHSFDARWIVILVALVGVFVLAIVYNSSHSGIDASRIETGLDIDNGDLDINWGKYATTDIRLQDSVNITEAGIYHISGSLSGGQIKISAKENEPVKLILDNVSISNSDGPAIICESADDLVIDLFGKNELEDDTKYSVNYDEDITGTIYSKADLTFEGDGTLYITANYQDGIVAKDDLKFASGTYDIAAVDDAIRGRDSVYVQDGNFILSAESDAIKTTNEENPRKGFVLIESGNFNITATKKGIKAISSISIKDGNFTIKSTDDALHSDNYIGIANGKIDISTGDDGMHADRKLIIENGEISINESYEGLEAQDVSISGGTINITASDDGINAGGGTDSGDQATERKDPFDADENCEVLITNGDIHINASGDGIDSNGWLYIAGGSTIIDGPTNDGNGALDSGMGIVMSGGEVLAIGSSGMAEAMSTASAVPSVSIYLPTTKPANSKIEIKNSEGKLILSHTSAKAFNHIAAGAPGLNIGEEYTIYLDGDEYQSFSVTGVTTTVGNGSMNQSAPQRPGRR